MVETKIPKRLREREYRFVKIQRGKKYPFEKGWQKDNNYRYDDAELQKHLESGGNYGVVCGYGDLVVIDADSSECFQAIKKSLPETFTVRTGGGGYHVYYICKDLDNPIRLSSLKQGDIGDVQWKGKQVVGANSIHPNGNRYELIGDVPIAQVTGEEIKYALRKWIPNRLKQQKINIDKLLKGFKIGQRNSSGIELASFVRRTGKDRETCVKILLKWNQRNEKPLPKSEIRNIVESAYRNEEPYNYFFNRNPKQYEIDENLTLKKRDFEEEAKKEIFEDIVELFTDEHGVPYATIRVGGHKENWPIRSRVFENYIVRKFFELNKENPPTQEKVSSIRKMLDAKAQFEGGEKKVHLRSAKVGNKIYIDICNNRWQVLEVSPKGIRVLDDSPVKFRRFQHMKKLEFDLDADVKALDRLFKFINVSKEEKSILRPHIALLFVPDIPYAISLFYGPQGSGKTMAMKLIRRCIDPSALKVLSLARNKTELVQQISHHYLPFFDNVTKLRKSYSDLFCRVITGEGFSKRELYTDDEDIIYNIIRHVGLNGINLASEEPDFLDRSVCIHLSRINRKNRKTEQEIWEEFRQEQPKITGAILKILQKTLGKTESVRKELNTLPRMADYAVWCEAASRSLGESPNTFLHKYFQKIEGLNKDALEASPVGLAILELMRNVKTWMGTPSELLNALEEKAEELKISTKQRMWPGAPNILSRRINDVKTNLQDEGILVESYHDGNKRIIQVKSIVSTVKPLVNPERASKTLLETDNGKNNTEKSIVNTVSKADDTNDNIRYSKHYRYSKNQGFNTPKQVNIGDEKNANDTNGISKNKFKKPPAETILHVLKEIRRIKGDKLVPVDGLYEKSFQNCPRKIYDKSIEKLKQEGLVFMPRPGYVKLI